MALYCDVVAVKVDDAGGTCFLPADTRKKE